MKAPNFDYQRATDSAAALAQMSEATGAAKFLAGGQSLGPMLNLRLANPSLLIDVSRCQDLRQVIKEPNAIVYGAGITHAEIEDGSVDDITDGWLRTVARGIAYRAVRNRGTIGGSVIHADPAADWPAVLLALGAEAIVRGPQGTRTIAFEHLWPAVFSTCLKPDELLTGIRVRKPGLGARWGYNKFCVKKGEFAKAMAAVYIDSAIDVARVVVAALDRPPLLLHDQGALIAQPAGAESVLRDQLPGLDPLRRRHLCVVIKRAVVAAKTDTVSAP